MGASGQCVDNAKEIRQPPRASDSGCVATALPEGVQVGFRPRTTAAQLTVARADHMFLAALGGVLYVIRRIRLDWVYLGEAARRDEKDVS
jgi:hypothetical protein